MRSDTGRTHRAELVGLEDALEGLEGALLDDLLRQQRVGRQVLYRRRRVHRHLRVGATAAPGAGRPGGRAEQLTGRAVRERCCGTYRIRRRRRRRPAPRPCRLRSSQVACSRRLKYTDACMRAGPMHARARRPCPAAEYATRAAAPRKPRGHLIIVEADHGDDAAEARVVAELHQLAVDGVAAAEVGDDAHGEDLVGEGLERRLHHVVERLQRAVADDAGRVLGVEGQVGQRLERLELLLQRVVPRVLGQELEDAARAGGGRLGRARASR